MRVVFMGTPDFAAASLQALIDDGLEIVGVFTQPDKAQGRGMKQVYSAVKEVALQNNLPVYQPEKMRDGQAADIIRNLRPDVLAVVAFGRILPDEILNIPVYGAINVHGSLLPKYRGSAPIQRAVINGDSVTGVTTMYLGSQLDCGDIIYTQSTEIGEFETSGQLFDRLKVIGASLLVKTLHDIENGTAPRRAQNPDEASYAAMLEKNESPIDWNMPARMVIKHIYGMQPWPGATSEIGGITCKIYQAEYTEMTTGEKPGTILAADNNGICISCGNGEVVRITELQAPGKKRMAAADYLRGHKVL